MQGESSSDRKSIGARGEEIATVFLRQQKYRIIENNYRCRCGEVDIIARDGKTIVFVEVKTRRTASYGLPQLAVTPFKQRQISKAALTYLTKNRLMEAKARFDVIGILLLTSEPQVNHIKDAFDLAY
jgi:putative endonuclease